MTRFLGPDELQGRVSPPLAFRAMQQAFALEGEARAQLVPRADIPSDHGFLRVMPAVLDEVMGLKVMTLAEGVGTRYLTLLYDAKNGELLALFDADELTRQRTAATAALAATMMITVTPRRLALIGSGFEAVGELRAFAALWPLEYVTVYSPNEPRRRRFAQHMEDELGLTVHPVPTAQQALADQHVVVLATKSATPVVDGADFAGGCVVLSIGSTRLDLRELDRETFSRAATVVGDDPQQLELESGDVADALTSGVLTRDRIVSLADLCAQRVALEPCGPDELLVFKSVGTALQDLAIARMVFEDAVNRDYGTDLGDLARLKPFASST